MPLPRAAGLAALAAALLLLLPPGSRAAAIPDPGKQPRLAAEPRIMRYEDRSERRHTSESIPPSLFEAELAPSPDSEPSEVQVPLSTDAIAVSAAAHAKDTDAKETDDDGAEATGAKGTKPAASHKVADDDAAEAADVPAQYPCHKPVFASNVPADQACSPECPFWAESALTNEPCYFRCVAADECGIWGQGVLGNATVADPAGYCRRCFSAACNLCHSHEDRCVDCQSGYELSDSGRCVHTFSYLRYFAYTVMACVCAYAVSYYIELMMRPNVNDEGVTIGLAHRSRTKLRRGKELANELDGAVASGTAGQLDAQSVAGQPLAEPQCSRPLWPLLTNLLTAPAGGPGCTLYFRFQMFWICWGAMACFVWVCIANMHSSELLELGLREADSPRDLCRIVEWGHRMTKDAVGMKVGFCISLYLCTVLGTLWFAAKQANYCNFLDSRSTMKDFAALLEGLPKLSGTELVETELHTFVASETGVNVVGVSVAWNIHSNGHIIRDVLEEDFEGRRQPEPVEGAGTGDAATAPAQEGHQEDRPAAGADDAAAPVGQEGRPEDRPAQEGLAEAGDAAAPLVQEVGQQDRPKSPMEHNGLRWRLFGFLDKVLMMMVGVPSDFEKHCPEELVRDMETTSYAWVVFESEEARDQAVEHFSTREVSWNKNEGSHPLKLAKKEEEPESVRWEAMNVDPSMLPFRIFLGSCAILLLMCLWCVFFYMPYAFYQSTFEYDANHQEPSGIEFLILGFVVVGGNAVLYLACSVVAEVVGFHTEAAKESLYMVLYFVSVMLNVALDVLVTGYISYLVMLGAGARTWGGKLLGELGTLQDVMEAYPMQKMLGYLLFGYSMPATFLVPFLMEPVCLIFTPYHLMRKVVRSNPYLKTWRAERSLSIFAPMDSGRYADLMINVTLATLILYVPSGWIFWTYGGLLMSHVYIYLFDHYRVLRSVPGFMFPDDTIDLFSWDISSVPCAVILCVAISKANCQLDGATCLRGFGFYTMILTAFFSHIVVHVLALRYVVPFMRTTEHTRSELKYSQVASVTPATWFTTNPAYCLRSQHVYHHDPPVGLFVRGKEHMLRSSPQGGHFFEDKPAVPEKYF